MCAWERFCAFAREPERRAVGGPIPLHRCRKHRKSRHEVRADQVAALAGKLALPRAALSEENAVVMIGTRRAVDAVAIPVRPFQDPDPFHEVVFANPIAARRAIADALRVPLATLSENDRAFIDALLNRALVRPDIVAAIQDRFPQGRRGGVGRCRPR
jgi:hypothetical protein